MANSPPGMAQPRLVSQQKPAAETKQEFGALPLQQLTGKVDVSFSATQRDPSQSLQNRVDVNRVIFCWTLIFSFILEN